MESGAGQGVWHRGPAGVWELWEVAVSTGSDRKKLRLSWTKATDQKVTYQERFEPKSCLSSTSLEPSAQLREEGSFLKA